MIAGKRRDRVFTSQLEANFTHRRIPPGYLDDWQTAAFATLLVWENTRAESRAEDDFAMSIVDHFSSDRLS